MATPRMTWLFVGSGPSAPIGLKAALDSESIDKTITCNSGIKLVLTDVYFCSDYVASFAFRDMSKDIQGAGTHLVTIDKPLPLLESHHTAHYDELVTPGDGQPTRERWGAYCGSGPFCIEYALRHGATRVVLVGCEGYVHNSPDDYFDGAEISRLFSRRQPVQMAVTKEVLEPAINSLAEAFGDVEFVCYGSTYYTVRQPNWKEVDL